MPVTFSSGEFGSKLSSHPFQREVLKNKAKEDLAVLMDQVDTGELKTGSKAIHEKLNELEKMGIATFGKGLRGFADVAGGGDKAYTRSQLGRLRGALYDPSQRDFDEAGTQVAGQELSAPDYEDYLAGRERLYEGSAFAQAVGGIGNFLNPAGLATGALSAARAYGEKYLPDFLKEQGLSYANLLHYMPRPDISSQFAGIASLPVNQTNPSGLGMVSEIPNLGENFQLASNQVGFKPTIQQTAYDTINSQRMYPNLNYPTLNTLA